MLFLTDAEGLQRGLYKKKSIKKRKVIDIKKI